MRKFAVCIAILLFVSAICVLGLSEGADVHADSSVTASVCFIKSEKEFYDLYRGGGTFANVVIELNVDIDANGLFSSGTGSIRNFYGTFEGNGHIIYNLSRPLFDTVRGTGEVKNLNLVGVDVAGCAVANSNYGKITNVNVSGTVGKDSSGRAGGVAIVNYVDGKIKDCIVYAEFAATDTANFGGIAFANTGDIENCVFDGTVTAEFTGNFSYGFSGIAFNNTGSIKGSLAATHLPDKPAEAQSEAKYRAAAIANGTAGTAESCVAIMSGGVGAELSVYGGTLTDITVVYGDGSDIAYFVDDENRMTEAAVAPAVSFGWMSGGSGTDEDPYLIYDYADLTLLKVFGTIDSYFYKVAAEIKLKGENRIEAFEGFTMNSSQINGDGYAFWSGTSSVFCEGFPVSTENVGFINCQAEVISSVGAVDGDYYIDYNTDFGKGSAPYPSVAAIEPEGQGEQNNPYIIENKEHLKWLENRVGYAILANDIHINSAGNPTVNLSITELKADINGNGKVISGLVDEALCDVLSGKIYNVYLRTNGGCVCNETAATATVGEVIVIGKGTVGIAGKNGGKIVGCSVYGEYESSFVTENDNTVERCVNYAEANKIFSFTGNGTLENSINYSTDNDATVSGGVTHCLDINGTKGYYLNGVKHESELGYLELNEAKFDFSEVFGYLKGSNEPSFRKFGNEYKEAISIFDNTKITSYAYNATPVTQAQKNFSITNINGNVYANTQYEWTLDGNPHSGNICDVGAYKVTARLSSTYDYLPAVESASFEITKARPSPMPTPVYSGFTDSSYIFTYGDEIVFEKHVPTNTDALAQFGYSAENAEYVFKKGVNVIKTVKAADIAGETFIKVANITDVGKDYSYSIILSSKNYIDLPKTVKVTVNQKKIEMTVAAECDYGTDYEPVTDDVKLVGLAEADQAKTIAGIVPDWKSRISANYVKGNKVGEYDILLDRKKENYEISVGNYKIEYKGGKLTVNKIPVPLDGVEFYGATKWQNGEYSEYYTGNVRELTVTLGETAHAGIGVTYENNGRKDCGEQTVTAKISIAGGNYEDVYLSAELKIKKLSVTVTAPSFSVTYGDTIDLSAYAVAVSDLAEGESVADIFGEFTIFCCDESDNIVSGKYLNKEYIVKTVEKEEPTNYAVTYVSGHVEVKKAFLTALKDGSESVTFKNGSRFYNGVEAEIRVDFFDGEEYADKVQIDYSVTFNGNPTEDAIKNAGHYVITATVTPLGDLAENYKATDYVCSYEIKKLKYDLKFSQSIYQFDYNGEDRGVKDLYGYTGLPDGYEADFTSGAIKDFGTYNIRISFGGGENEEACYDTASVEIKAKEVTVAVTSVYTYNGQKITPEVVSVEGDVGEGLAFEDISFICKNSAKENADMRNYGDYYVTPVIANKNYKTSLADIKVTVNQAEIPLSIGKIKYNYGFAGLTEQNDLQFNVFPTYIIVVGYYDDENVRINVKKEVDTYRIEAKDVNSETNPNYKFVPTGENTVVIESLPINAVWKLDGVTVGNEYQTIYTGASQNERFVCTVDKADLRYDEDPADLDIRLTFGGDGKDIFNVGTYYINAGLWGTTNYVIAKSELKVKVTKADLEIYIDDAVLWQREYYNFSCSIRGNVGVDANKDLQLLAEDWKLSTQYTVNSPVGSKFSVTVENISFRNYEVKDIRQGTITVEANPYPDYNGPDYWHNVQKVYTGEEIAVEIKIREQDNDKVRVSYENNRHKNVGRYENVKITVTYPTKNQSTRTVMSYCVLDIIKATPVVSVEPREMLYIENHYIVTGDIKGSASYNGERVIGRFEPQNSEQPLLLGTASYAYRFVPYDDTNFNECSGTFVLKTAKITFADFTFEPPDGITPSDEDPSKISISDTVTMRLKAVMSGLRLFRNGSLVDYVVFDKTETVTVEVTFEDEVAYSSTFYVELEEKVDPFVINIESFSLSGGSIVDNKIFIDKDTGGRLSLDERYADGFYFIVNGRRLSECILNGDEGEIEIIVKSVVGDVTVYGAVITVGYQEEETTSVSNYKLYYIIGGCVLGVAVLLTVALIIWKKRHE